MKDKIYKLNRPKGFYIFKRAVIAFTSVLICCVCVAVPLSILIYTQSTPEVKVDDEVNDQTDFENKDSSDKTTPKLELFIAR